MSAPRVSVIIPTYNSAATAGRAIASVLAQTFGDLEVIVIDEASKDDIEGVVGGFTDPRLHLHRWIENTGLPGARNKGIRLAKGEVVGFLDSDDEWYPRKLERQLALLDADARVGVVYCGIDFAEDGEVIGTRRPRHRGRVLGAILGQNVVGNASTFLIRRRLFDEAGLFNERLRTFGEDWDLLIRLARVSDFDFCEEPLTRYYFHANHKSGELVGDPAKSVPDRLWVLEAYRTDFERHPDAMAMVLRRIGVLWSRAGRRVEALRYFWQAVRCAPMRPVNVLALGAGLLGRRPFSAIHDRAAAARRQTHALALTRAMKKHGRA